MESLERLVNLIGEDNVNKLKKSKVIVFGLGGVGGYIVEALARSGVGTIGIVDNDYVSLSNINRQIIALENTVGMLKTELFESRIKSINSNINVISYPIFYDSDNMVDISGYDYVIDAIDSVKSKLLLICQANRLNIPIISSMGTANKLDPTKLIVTDINKTHTCPLAKKIRVELRKEGIKKLKCLFSSEVPINEGESRSSSIVTVVAVSGMLIANEVIKDLIN